MRNRLAGDAEVLDFMRRRHRRRRGPEGRHDLRRGGARGARSSPATRPSCATGRTPTRSARNRTSPTNSTVATFPGFGGNEGAGVVGGYNLGISAYTDNPDGSLAFAEFLVTEPVQKEMFLKATLPAVSDRGLRRPRGEEGTPLHRGTAESGRTGAGAAGLAGLHGNLRSDRRQRLRSAERQAVGRRGDLAR